MVEYLGFEDNMSKVSWFPPETPSKAENIDDDETLTKAAHYGIGSGTLTLYVVREDDPYIGAVTTLADEVDDIDVNNEVDCDGRGENVNGDVNEDSSGGEEDYFSGSDSDGKVELDEKKYRGFEVGQEYKTIDSFKSALNRYAVNKKRDIKYKKFDSKRVSSICSDGKCPWRIYASINSSSPRVIIRSLQDEHNCTWQGKMSLLTTPRSAEIFIEEFRFNPDFSANQLQEKLLAKNINVP